MERGSSRSRDDLRGGNEAQSEKGTKSKEMRGKKPFQITFVRSLLAQISYQILFDLRIKIWIPFFAKTFIIKMLIFSLKAQ